MNIVFLQGNLAKDPDLRYSDNGRPYALCTVAVDRPHRQGAEKTADFISVIIGGSVAETVAEKTKKGTAVWVLGALRTRTYQDGTGKKRFAMDVSAWRVGVVLSPKAKNGVQNDTVRGSASRTAPSARQDASLGRDELLGPPAFPDLPEDFFDTETGEFSEDDLPF
ncbi:single-stranded DNA-binding protein [Moorellaceae bacterium AZ2]